MGTLVQAAWRWSVVGTLTLGACGKKTPVVVPKVEDDALITALRERVIPNPVQARFSVKMHSEQLGITAPPLGSGLVVDRPGRAFVVVMNPVGGPVLSLTADGSSVGMMNARDKQWVTTDDAEGLLGGADKSGLTMDDLVGLLLGLLPLHEEEIRERTVVEAGVRLVADGPGDTVLAVLVDPATATPIEVSVVDAQGVEVVTAAYEPFMQVEEALYPSRLHLYVAPIDLDLDLKFKSWKNPEVVPEVFGMVPPEGFEVLSFEDYGEAMAGALGDAVPADEPEAEE